MNLNVVPQNVLSELSANRLVATDAASELASVSNLASWIAGTSNQISVANDGDGTITLSTPQNIHTGASPTFIGETLTGLTTSRIVSTNGSNALSSVANLQSWVIGTIQQISTADNGNGTITLSIPNPLTLGGPEFTRSERFRNMGTSYLGNTVNIFGIGTGGQLNILGTIAPDAGLAINCDTSKDVTFATTGNDITFTSVASIVLNTPSVTLSNFTGLLKGTSGVVSAITDNSATWNAAQAGDATLTALAGLDSSTGFLKQTAADTFSKDTFGTASYVPFANATGLSYSANLTFVDNATPALAALTSAGIVSAEQLTSTDDLTMQGKLLNTLATADTQALIIDGDTNKYTYAPGNVTFGSLSRTVIGTGAVMPTGSYGWLRALTWDYDFSGTVSNLGNTRFIGAGGDTLNYSGNIEITTGGLAAGSYGNRFIANFSTLPFTGAFSNEGTKNFTGSWIGGYFGASTTAGSFVNSGTGTNTIIFCGGQFTTQRSGGSPLDASGAQPTAPSPSVTGTVNLIYCGGLFLGIGTTDGTSISYGAYCSGYGSDTNYDVYAPNSGSTNYFAGLVDAQLSVQIGIAPTANSSGTVAIVAKDANLLTANAEWIAIKNSSGVTRYIPVWA